MRQFLASETWANGLPLVLVGLLILAVALGGCAEFRDLKPDKEAKQFWEEKIDRWSHSRRAGRP